MAKGQHGFSEKARLAGVRARKRNNRLRKLGKLPPIKRGKHLGGGESIDLNSPIFDKPEKRKYKVKGALANGSWLKAKGGNEAIVLRLLALIERLV